MKKSIYTLLILLLLAGSFLAGSWYSHREPATGSASEGRRILYYVDPMNPAHTADKPGLAPCGMKMEPVYADDPAGQTSGTTSTSMSPGTIRISPEKQQMIGVRIGQTEKTSGSHPLRTLGRVVIDENRTYRLIAPVEGWVKEIHGGTTGSIVQKDQLLAYFYTRDILTPQQTYFYALNALDRFKKEGAGSQVQVSAQIRLAEESLLALGMGEAQIKEIAKTRQAARDIEIRAPVSGLVLQRNIYPNLRFDRGTEWYRIADINRIWILADIFENEAHYFGPGVHAKVTLPYQQKMFQAMMSDTPPQFDPATRTLKVRLEMDNPGLALRPDMFVDVEFPVKLPAALTVPVDAVLDSGLKKTVFVDRGNGFFEPRNVETGWRMGDRVEIVKGLMPGERIVISGTFLLDSESRMKLAAAGMSKSVEARSAKDLVCGMDVDESKAKAAARMIEYRGKAYYFCTDECKEEFIKNPGLYVEKPTGRGKPGVTPIAAQIEQRAKDPICGMDVDRNKAKAAGRISDHRGKTYYFCTDDCKQTFDKDPMRYVEEKSGDTKHHAHLETPSAHASATPVDPVCRMKVAAALAEKAGLKSQHNGSVYYFCTDGCKQQFEKNPDHFLKGASLASLQHPMTDASQPVKHP